MAPQRRSPIVALLVALAGLAVAVFVGTQAGGDDASSAASPVSVSSSASGSVSSSASVSVSSSASGSVSSTRTTEQAAGVPQASGVPRAAWATLAAIDAGRWPPSDAPGTEGGRTFGNHEGRLPATGSGQQIRYQEWDVNRKQSGRGRDGHRIVTGNDGSAWYTDDHYETFTRMR